MNREHSRSQRQDRSDRYCVVGAGSSGLVAAKNLLQQGIAVDVLEKARDLGGIWNQANPASSVYNSTHLISSKPLTEYTDFPMPEHYPDYPRHDQVLQYFRDYADRFDLHRVIELKTGVAAIEPEGEGWLVGLENQEARLYAGVVIANGHLWDPKFPDYPGDFSGETLHSRDYRTSDTLKGKRVLVVGAGNSGCDIAVEAAQNAKEAFHSVRRGYHYIPKYLFGKPADQVGEASLRMRVPLPLRRVINSNLIRLLHGKPENFGLPKPDHKLFETHPIVNSQIFYYLGHGDITPKPDVERLDGDSVHFKDGSRERIDVIIFATGFKISFPFIDREHLNWNGTRPGLFMHVLHPTYDNLFVAGLIQPDSGQWGLVDYQTQLIAKFVKACRSGDPAADKLRRLKIRESGFGGNSRYLKSSRHALEVEHFSYRLRLKKLLKNFN